MEQLQDDEVYLDTACELMKYRKYTNVQISNNGKFNFVTSDQCACRYLEKAQKLEI